MISRTEAGARAAQLPRFSSTWDLASWAHKTNANLSGNVPGLLSQWEFRSGYCVISVHSSFSIAVILLPEENCSSLTMPVSSYSCPILDVALSRFGDNPPGPALILCPRLKN